jgi:hypothetical protein
MTSTGAFLQNPYAEFNDRLFSWIRNGGVDREQIDVYLAAFAQLPQPQGEHAWQQLAASRLDQTIPNVVKQIGKDSYASGKAKPGDSRRIIQLWQQSARLSVPSNARSLATYIRTLLSICPKRGGTDAEDAAQLKSLVADIWSSSRRILRDFNGSTWGLFAEIARRFRQEEMLRQIWQECTTALESFTPRTWGAFASAASDLGMPEVMAEIWSACQAARGDFNDWTWGAFLQAAGKRGQADLLEVWGARCDHFQAFLGACADAAFKSRSKELLKDAWLTGRRICSRFTSRTWGSFANAAGRMLQRRLLSGLWERWRSTNSLLDSRGWGSFASAAGRTRQGDLLKEIWEKVQPVVSELDAAAVASFADSAWKCPEQTHLLRSVWQVCRSMHVSLNSRAWGSFAKAAGRTTQRDLLREIFDAFKDAPGDFGPEAWVTFADAAGNAADAGLVQEIWERFHTLPIAELAGRPHLGGQLPQSLLKLGGTFIRAASKAERPELLLRVFRGIREWFDFTLRPDWGAFFYPLLRAARACTDESVQAEILASLRTPTEPAEKLFQVTRDPVVVPMALDTEGGQFEGACRCLMRSLIDSFFLAPTEFQGNVRDAVVGIMSLPDDRRTAVWPRFLGRGQEEYGSALRAWYADEFRRTAGVGRTPWHALPENEKQRVIKDIQEGGMVARLEPFVRETAYRPRGVRLVKDERVNRCPRLAQLVIDNYLGHLTHASSDVCESSGRFFSTIQEMLDEATSNAFTNYDWETLIIDLIQELGDKLSNKMMPKIVAVAHDLDHAALQQSSKWLANSHISQEEMNAIGASVVGMLQCFEDATQSIGVPRRAQAVNIGLLARAILGSTKIPCSLREVDIPKMLPILAWTGAKSREIKSLLREIRRDAVNGLRTFPPEQQQYSCVVRCEGASVRFEITYTINADKTRIPVSLVVGSWSILNLVMGLGGKFEPGKLRHLDWSQKPPRCSITFTLPAGEVRREN